MSYTHLHHLKIKGRVEADKFITKDGTSNDFVKGDGSLDNTEYAEKTYVDDEFAKKSTTVKGVGALEGGGDLTEDREIDLTQETKDNIAKGVTAHGWGNHADEGYATETYVGDAIDDIEIGGRNYLLKSNIDQRGWGYTGSHKIYSLSERIKEGEQVTATININYSGNSDFRVRTQKIDGNTSQQDIPNSDLLKIGDGVYRGTFNWSNSLIDSIHIFKDDPKGGETWDLNWVKLEKGNKATDWSPAPEDHVTDWNETNPDSYSFLKNKPTTFPPSSHTHTFASLTSKPTTIAGYGITDFNSLGDARWALRSRTITGTGSLTGGGNLTANRTLDLTATTKSDIAKGVTAHGWGDFRDYGLGVNDSEVTNNSHNDLRTGFYTSNTGTQNLPAGVTGNAFILAMKPREDRAHRLIAAMGRDRIFWQRDFNGWQDPVEFWHSGNLTNVSQLNNDAGYITSVPDSFVTKNNINSSALATTVIDFDAPGNGASILYAGASSTNVPSVSGTAGGLLMRGNHSTVGEYQLYLARGENDALLYRNQSGVWNRAASREWVNNQGFLKTAQAPLTNSTTNTISGTQVRRAALTGDVTAAANSNATTIVNNAVTTAKIANSAVTHAKYQNIATQRILGRGATGTGNVQELTLGSNLSLSTSGVLSATNTTYSAGTLALLNAGTDTTNRLWSSKILSDYINQYAGDNLGLQGVTDIGNWTSNEIEFRVLGNDMFTITPGSTNSDASNAAGGVPAIYSRNKGFLFVDGNTTNTGSISTADYVPYKFGIISNTAVWGNSFTMGSDFGFNFGYRGPGNISNSNPFVNINLDTQEHHLERLDDRTVSSNQSITQRLHFPPEDGTLATREWILEGDDSGTTPPTGDPSLGVVWDTVYRKYRLRNNFTFDHVNKAIDAVDTKYTAGSNVTINSSNVISATNTTYSAGSLAHLIAGTQTANMVWSAKNLSDYVESKTDPNQVVITSSLTTNAGHNGSTIVFNGNSAALTVNGTMGAGAEIYLINNTGGNRTISSSMISFSLRENGTSTTKSSLQLKPFGVATLVRLSSGTMFMCYGDLI